MSQPTDIKSPATGELAGVGIGPGAVRYLTLEAVEALRNADILIDIASAQSSESVSMRVIDELGECPGERVHFITPMSRDLAKREVNWQKHARTTANWLREGKKIAYVTLGDPLIYSTFGYLRRAVLALEPTARIRAIPGITSFQAAASRTGETLLENEEILTLMPATASPEKRKQVLPGTDTAVVLKASRNKPSLFAEIDESLQTQSFLYATRLEQPDEAVTQDPSEAESLPDTYLSLFIAKRRNHDL
ncbi:precorrin-2 C(20)-methyltransferase [Puniceicoccus vermicola]|uniref:Precorrin-2 C(20)-methyltransferase n=1 Tax=Puniceicoccus vermicola TaxID=388746 RepID=A0A7X1E6P4_9BACT|nr:precorrin-2 C(20)-methyltransferase [Puniceicoccus vermicola]MBC2602872.1 precorrin-2 C(20)-methyltransferase [Puniceicoccus vermicola]